MLHKIFTLFGILWAVTGALAQCPGPAQRNALLNLERSIAVEGTKAGQIPLTDTCGNQRYAQYVEVNLDTIAYTPTSTGNTQNLSEFVIDPLGSLYYIDWQGNSVQFAGGAGSCDVDWLQISDNSCPDAITDSIYKQKYASIGARLVWPGAELLVNDSTGSGIAVVQGSRNARLALYDGNTGNFLMFDEGGTAPVVYMPVAANLIFKTTAGTPQTPIGSQVNHFAINAQDSTIQMFQYPSTRVDTQTVVNFLYTDPVGKIRSQPASSFPLAGLGGIYGGSGSVPNGTAARMAAGNTFYFGLGNGATWAAGDIVDTIDGVALDVSSGAVRMGDVYGASDYYGIFGLSGNYIRSPSSNFQQLNGQTVWDLLLGPYRFTDSRATVAGVEYSSSAYGPQFSDSTLVHRRYVKQMIADSIAAHPGGIYGGSGNIPDGTAAKLSNSGSFVFQYNSGSNAIEIDDGTGYVALLGPGVSNAVRVDNTRASLEGSSGALVTATGADVIMQNNGGNVTIGGGGTASQLIMLEASGSGTNYTSFQTQAQAADITYTLPASDGASGNQLTTNGSGTLTWTSAGGAGTVTSFSAGNLSPLFTTSVATATTTPALTFTQSNANANVVYAGPTTGSPAAPTFRSLVAADLPAGTGTVTSVGLSLPAIFSVSGSPVTTSGTLTSTLANETANTFFAGPTSGGAAAPTFRTMVAADLPVGVGGAFVDGGNSFAATGTLGTNDANTMAFETNNVTRATLNTSGVWNVTDDNAATNTSVEKMVIGVNSNGATTSNFGPQVTFNGESATNGNNSNMAALSPRWSNSGGTDARLVFNLTGSSTLKEIARLTYESTSNGEFWIGNANPTKFGNSGITPGIAYTIGGNALGVTLSSTGTSSTQALLLNASGNNTSASGTIGAALFTTTTGTKRDWAFSSGFTPTSGTGIYYNVTFNPTINQTGGANGATGAISFEPILTAIGSSWSALTMATSNSSAYFLNQSGANTLNYLNGKLGCGDSSPETQLDVAGTAGVVRLIGQDNTPTITVDAAQAGTGASASMTNAQSSDLAGRFSITTGTGATAGRWATITFGAAYATTPVVIVGCEDADCANVLIDHYVNVSTTTFEVFITGTPSSSTTHDFSFHVIGGK